MKYNLFISQSEQDSRSYQAGNKIEFFSDEGFKNGLIDSQKTFLVLRLAYE